MAADGTIVIDTAIKDAGFKAGTKELEAHCKRLAQSVEGMSQKQQVAMQKAVNALSKQNAAYAQQEQKVADLKRQLSGMKGNTVATDEYVRLTAELAKAEKALDAIGEKQKRYLQTGGNSDTVVQRYEYDADRAREKVEALKAKIEALKASGGAFTTADTSALESKLSAEQAKLEQQYSALNTSYAALSQRTADLGQKTANVASKTNVFSSAAEKAAGVVQKLSSTVLHGFATAAKKAASAVARLAARLGGALKNALKSVGGYAKSAAARLFGLGKGTKDLGGGMKSGLRTVLKYAFGIRSLYVLFRKLRSALVDGMNNLVRYSDTTNKSISSIKSSLTSAKNAVATAFAPLLNAVAPVLTKLIDMLATAFNYISAFFAAITGQSTYTRAVAVQEDYAASLGGTTDALNDNADAASGAAAANKDFLSGLDEIHKFDDGSGSGGGGGGSGGGSGSGGSGPFFEEAAIPGLVTDWAQRFKDAWANADFTEIGTVVGTKLKDALDSIPWEGIQETCNRVAQSVATFINGFVATPGLWETVGSTIGNGINTAVGMWNTFFDKTNFENIGSAIATALDNAISTINATELGRALSQRVKTVVDTAYGFVKNFSFAEFGTFIGNTINGFFTNIDFGKMGTALGGALGGVITAGAQVISTVDFSSIGTNISTALSNALSEISTAVRNVKWADLGRNIVSGINGLMSGGGTITLGGTVSTAINSALSFIGGAIDGAEWGSWASTVAANINDFFNIDFGKAGTVTGNFLGSFANFIFKVVDDVDWDKLATDFGDYINGLFSAISEADLSTGVRHLIETFASTIESAIKNIDWLLILAELFDLFNSILYGAWNATFGNIPGLHIDDDQIFDYSEDYWNNYSNFNTGEKPTLQVEVEPTPPARASYLEYQDEWGWAAQQEGPLKAPVELEAGVDLNREATAEAIREKIGKGPSIQIPVEGDMNSVNQSHLDPEDKVVRGGGIIAENMSDKIPLKQKEVTATLKGKADTSFNTAKASYDSVKNSIATKMLAGSIPKGGTFATVRTEYGKIINASATKTLYGAIPSGGTFSVARTEYNRLANASATKTLYGKIPSGGSFAVVRAEYGKIANAAATKTVFGDPRSSFNSLTYNYDRIKDKTVTVTVNGRSNGVAYGGGWYGYTQATGGVFSGGKWHDIARFASGGLARGSQLFWAREAGPELVGTLGGHTAVMNNDQIVASVAAGVYKAVAAAFSSLGSYFARMANAIHNIPVALDGMAGYLANLQGYKMPMPAVATGTVIPPGAVYSDRSNREIRDALSGLSDLIGGLTGTGGAGTGTGGIHVDAKVRERVLFETVIEVGRLVRAQSGKNPFEL